MRLTVAVVGPDGAGKTTVVRQVVETAPFPVVNLYMGVSPESSNRVLPTTRLVRRLRRGRRTTTEPEGGTPRPPSGGSSVRAVLRLCNRVAEECYRQALTSWHRRRGAVVLFDRHFFADFYTKDITRSPDLHWTRRAHGFFLDRLYPRPDLIVYLDAPARVLLDRKGEGTIESLEEQRQGYLRLRDAGVPFALVDATQPLPGVVSEVLALVAAGRGDQQPSPR